MNRYIIGRVLFVMPIMLILSFFTFALTYLSPSDPITLKYERMGAVPDKALVEAEKEAAGLNEPFLVQYWNWLKNVLRGDLGKSYFYSTSVWSEMSKRIPNTLVLTGATLLLTVLIATPLGILSAVKQGTWVDGLIRFVSFFGVSVEGVVVVFGVVGFSDVGVVSGCFFGSVRCFSNAIQNGSGYPLPYFVNFPFCDLFC